MATFLLRVSLIICVVIGSWVDFTRDYPDSMGGSFRTAMLPLQFFIYNVVPIFTLMLLHYRNFKPNPNSRSSFPILSANGSRVNERGDVPEAEISSSICISAAA